MLFGSLGHVWKEYSTQNDHDDYFVRLKVHQVRILNKTFTNSVKVITWITMPRILGKCTVMKYLKPIQYNIKRIVKDVRKLSSLIIRCTLKG